MTAATVRAAARREKKATKTLFMTSGSPPRKQTKHYARPRPAQLPQQTS